MEEREKFIKNLEDFFVHLGVAREKHDFSEKSIFDNATHKEMRQKDLDIFFRVICLQVHGNMSDPLCKGHQISPVKILVSCLKRFAYIMFGDDNMKWY